MSQNSLPRRYFFQIALKRVVYFILITAFSSVSTTALSSATELSDAPLLNQALHASNADPIPCYVEQKINAQVVPSGRNAAQTDRTLDDPYLSRGYVCPKGDGTISFQLPANLAFKAATLIFVLPEIPSGPDVSNEITYHAISTGLTPALDKTSWATPQKTTNVTESHLLLSAHYSVAPSGSVISVVNHSRHIVKVKLVVYQ